MHTLKHDKQSICSRKTVDQSVQGSTLVNDNELIFTAEANQTYAIHFDLVVSAALSLSSGNDRIKFACIAPDDATARCFCFALIGDYGNINATPFHGPLPPASQGTPGSWFAFGGAGAYNSPYYVWTRITALVVMGPTPGVVGLQFSEYQASESGTPAIVYAGSSAIVKKQG